MSYNTNVKLPCVIRKLQYLSEDSKGKPNTQWLTLKFQNGTMSSELTVAPCDFSKVSLVGSRRLRDRGEAPLCTCQVLMMPEELMF